VDDHVGAERALRSALAATDRQAAPTAVDAEDFNVQLHANPELTRAAHE
jgi:hypothetical protein